MTKPCPMPVDEHIALGRSVQGGIVSATEPHAHPFGLPARFEQVVGLVACCTRTSECRVDGHISFDGAKYVHAEVAR